MADGMDANAVFAVVASIAVGYCGDDSEPCDSAPFVFKKAQATRVVGVGCDGGVMLVLAVRWWLRRRLRCSRTYLMHMFRGRSSSALPTYCLLVLMLLVLSLLLLGLLGCAGVGVVNFVGVGNGCIGSNVSVAAINQGGVGSGKSEGGGKVSVGDGFK